LALQAEDAKKKETRRTPAHRVTHPLQVLVVLNVAPVLSPHPRVVNGELLETHFDLDAGSRTAVERAIELKATSENVTVTAIAVAPRYATDLLRRALALGADDATLIETEELPDDPHAVARFVANHIGRKQLSCDLAVCGEPVLATVLAGNLGLSHFSDVKEFVVNGVQTTITARKPEVTLTINEPVVLAMAESVFQLDFTVDDYFNALDKPLEIIDAYQIATQAQVEMRYRMPEMTAVEQQAEATPEAAAALVRKIAGIETAAKSGNNSFAGTVGLTDRATLPMRDTAVFVATPEKLDGIGMAMSCAEALMLPFHVVLFGEFDESGARSIAARVPAGSIHFVSSPQLAEATPAALLAALQTIWKDTLPTMFAAGASANELLAQFARTFPRVQAQYDVVEVVRHNGTVQLVCPAFGGKVQRVATVAHTAEHPLVMTVGKDEGGGMRDEGTKRVSLVPLEFEYDRAGDEMANALAAVKSEVAAQSIADAEFIIDVGYAVRNKENFDLVITPLKKRLEEIGVKNVMLGGTRKVVEELKLLSPGQQIGQTGTPVNPQLIISIGVSGAPQHVDYIGERATIIAFNKDADAPLMTLNKRRARPRVVPIIGDLFETVPQFTSALRG
jgi:electron transfer flavoprotein alpha subunit